MESYAPELLQPKDLVLTEVHIARYRTQDDDNEENGSSSKGKKKAQARKWDKWRAHFELKAISLIAKAPKEVVKEDDEVADVTI